MNVKLEKLSEDILKELKTLNQKNNDINKEIIDALNKILKNQEVLLKDKTEKEELEELNCSIPVIKDWE